MAENPVTTLITEYQELVAEVPGIVQPLIVAAAGAIPFIEAELSAIIAIVGGIHPLVAATAAAAGNLLSVILVVFIGDRIRTAALRRSGGTPKPAPTSKKRERFRRTFERFGVPGVSLLGPLVLPTQLTAATLVASGVSKGRVIFWQAIAIVVWTSLGTGIALGVIDFTS